MCQMSVNSDDDDDDYDYNDHYDDNAPWEDTFYISFTTNCIHAFYYTSSKFAHYSRSRFSQEIISSISCRHNDG